MGWGRLELGDRGAATGAWQVYLQVLTPSGPSGDTGAPPVPLDARPEFQSWPKLEGRKRVEKEAKIQKMQIDIDRSRRRQIDQKRAERALIKTEEAEMMRTMGAV